MLSYHNSTKQLTESGVDTAIISVGSTEQCGPYLPFHLDTLLAQYFSEAWGKILNAYVLPTLPFNTAEEHSNFKGTVTLRPQTVMLVLEEVVQGLRVQGFRKQVLTVGHGGSWWVSAFIKDINWMYRDIILVNAHAGADPVWEQALKIAGLPKSDIHGGIVSKAIASYLAPNDVQNGEFGEDVADELIAHNGYVTWEKITRDGSWGKYTEDDANLATAERGRTLLTYFTEHHGKQLKEHFVRACQLKGI
ncbi:MAG TPA: creatininase family protein, partial [Caldilineaceae bacterium]|nr:creatininase family protein [Caldilineaceae bacterium]